MHLTSIFPALLAAVATVTAVSPGLAARQSDDGGALQACADLTISSNNGDRKVALVVDTSSSMFGSDPDNLRLAAARALNEFLISNDEAGGGRNADQVAVVGFDSSSYTVFGPGDPGDPAANEAISSMDGGGGTYIASGVYEAIGHINAMSGATKDRSAIVVFTDGSDSDTPELVSAINDATALGIRVSFGYLDTGSGQPDEVLLALRESRGVYATIAFAAGSQNFVNYVLLNGLTYQDNPQGAGDRLLAGLGTTQFVSGSDTVALKYGAEQGENVNFTVVSFTGDRLSVEAKMGGQTLYTTTRATSSDQFFEVTAPGTGQLDLFVTSPDSPTDGLFSVLTNSNQPIKNCTVGVAPKDGGLTPGAKAGLAVGIIAAVAGLAGGGFYAYKHFLGGNTAAPPGMNTTGTSGMEGNHTSFDPRAEKFQPDTSVSPVGQQPLHGAPTNGMPMDGFGSMPSSGFEGNVTGQDLGNGVHGNLPSDIPPNGGPLTGSGGIPTADMPPTGAPGGGGSGVPGAFVPPMMPPLLPPKDQQQNLRDAPPGSIHPQHTQNPQQPLAPHNHYQNPGFTYQNQHQQTLGGNPGAGYQQPLGGHHGYPPKGPSPAGTSGSGFGAPISHGADPNNTTCHPPHPNSNPTSSPVSGNSTNGQYYPAGPDQNHTDIGQWDPAGNRVSPPPPAGGGQVTQQAPGLTVPGPPGWQQASDDKHRHHHHHPWLAPDMSCEHPACELNQPGHVCLPNRQTCGCVCRDAGCPLRRRGW
ncbi:VWFA domain-containing protein [Madurella fahalii]|uniref:VWFA domain-containing protein n=1 Tax=Madurella fahalii TaxID=1157608 RepID=A0ABQ0FXJ6_9PEZI